MSISFELNNYAITSSLNERTIYIKVIDKITFMCYENNIESKELRLSIDLKDVYKLITKCFLGEKEHSATFNIISGTMKITFIAVVGGYLNINFELLLREKVMSNDSQLTMNFHRIEQTQLHAIQTLSKKIEQLERLTESISYAEIYMLKNHANQNSVGGIVHWKLNTKEMSLSGNHWDYSKIKLFYQLEKLSFTGCNDIPANFINGSISNDTVKEIILYNLSSVSLTSLRGVNEFPNLEKISINNCAPIHDIVSILNSYEHKIKMIDIKSCIGINNTELMTYCQKNNIKLQLA